LAELKQTQAPASSAGGVLVGRDPEMRALLDALESARSGQGRLVLLAGEAGIGKTRLADAFAREARRTDARVLWGRCWEAGGAPAYWPWLQAIRVYLRDSDPAALRLALGSRGPHLARILPELRDLLLDLPELPHEDSDESRFQIFEATATFLRNVSSARPLVLVLDDLHVADEPSLRLLQFVAADMSDSRLLVIATYREEDVLGGDARPGLLADLGRSPAVQRLTLFGLGEGDVSRYIELAISASPPAGLVEAVHRETQGNPLFVGEVVRLLAEEGRLSQAQNALGRPFRIPKSVRVVIGRRLARLSESCRELLSRASVIGVEVPLDLLARLEGQPPEALLDLLDEGAAARVVDEPSSPGGRWRFGHGLVRDVLYAALPSSSRVLLHRRIGETLEALHGNDQEPPLAELAHHFLAAAAGPKAVEYARRAAERAMELAAYEEAVRLYRLAIEAGELEEAARCQLLLGLGARCLSRCFSRPQDVG
jgi:Predicted ATPase